MENLLINFLLTNCKTLAKEFFSSQETTPVEGDSGLNFLNLLNTSMGSGITMPKIDIVNGSASKADQDKTAEGDGSKEDGRKESLATMFNTQSIVALFQTYFKTEDLRVANLQDDTKLASLKNFLRNIFSLLQEGESIQFVKGQQGEIASLLQPLEPKVEEKKTVEAPPDPEVRPETTMENTPFINYLATILQQFSVAEKTVTDGESAKVENKDTISDEKTKAQGDDVSQMSRKAQAPMDFALENKKTSPVIDETVTHVSRQVEASIENLTAKSLLSKPEIPIDPDNKNKGTLDIMEVKSLLGKSEIPIDQDNGNKETLSFADATVKTASKIEIRKLDGRDNTFQIISSELPTDEGAAMKKNISVLTAKMEKPVSSRDDDTPKIISKVSEKAANDYDNVDARRLFSQNDYTKTNGHFDKEAGKMLDKQSFASIMTEKIDKIVEQYANKNISMDMVVRLKIDEKETLLVGLKDHGQRVTVEVRTTNESMGTFLQSQKEEIARQLETKHVYANIYVDVQNENSQKREQRNNQNEDPDEKEREDFGAFLGALA